MANISNVSNLNFYISTYACLYMYVCVRAYDLLHTTFL